MSGYTMPGFAPSNVAFDPTTGEFKYWDGSAWIVALQVGALTGNEISAGQSSVSRLLATSNTTLSSGTLRLSYMTSKKTETWTKIKTLAVGTAAGATPTLCKMLVYSVGTSGDLTLAASAGDTSLWATANANGVEYEATLDVAVGAVRGSRYALGAMCITGATAPTILSTPATLPITEGAVGPRLCGVRTGNTEVPTTISAGIVGATNVAPYIVVKP